MTSSSSASNDELTEDAFDSMPKDVIEKLRGMSKIKCALCPRCSIDCSNGTRKVTLKKPDGTKAHVIKCNECINQFYICEHCPWKNRVAFKTDYKLKIHQKANLHTAQLKETDRFCQLIFNQTNLEDEENVLLQNFMDANDDFNLPFLIIEDSIKEESDKVTKALMKKMCDGNERDCIVTRPQHTEITSVMHDA